ncbi:putative ORFan [Tupanvirus deep ocean]|uniref:ORFan n=2 Tax=Tupanvirus TaxID=2094720 RepID=A0AC62A848_9VIRU|nr:putative ORFan [Tupanvirus deep ocean]QKU33956.1 putative ORFan [Tupanvirus deep ocean]
MIIVTNTNNGVKLSYKHEYYLQDFNVLNDIWNNPNQYNNIVNEDKIRHNNKKSDKYFIDFDFNEILPEIDISEPLSYLSDCIKEYCIYDRFRYKTRNVAFNYFLDIAKNKINNSNILFLGSFRLLSELFYLSELMKNGFVIKEIHLLDQTYSKFLSKLQNMKILDHQFVTQNKDVSMFYQFLEYFHANNHGIDIYVHNNPILMGIQNANRIDITISIDGLTPHMTDVLSLIGTNLVNHDSTINFNSHCIKSEFINFKYDSCYSYTYIFTTKNKNTILDIIEPVSKLKSLPELVIINSLYNTIYYDDIKDIIDYDITNKIIYSNLIFYLYLILIIFISILVYYIVTNKEYYEEKIFWIFSILLVIFLIYLLSKFINYRPLHILKL